MTYSRKQMALLVAAFILLVAVVAVPSALTLGRPFGPRETMPTLKNDNTLQYLPFKNTQNNKYFLRAAIKNPSIAAGLIFRASDDRVSYGPPILKSVDIVIKGQTSKGKTVVAGIKDIKHISRKSEPGMYSYREFWVPEPLLINAVPDKDDFFNKNRIEWVSFDVELNFPVSATWKEQYDFFMSVVSNLQCGVYALNSERVPGMEGETRSSKMKDPMFKDLVEKTLGPAR